MDGFTLPQGGMIPWLIMLLAVVSFYGQLMLTKALQCEEAAIVSMTRSASEVVIAFLCQIAIFRDVPDWFTVLGAILVTVSVLLTSTRKWVLSLPPDSRRRKLLKFVTM